MTHGASSLRTSTSLCKNSIPQGQVGHPFRRKPLISRASLHSFVSSIGRGILMFFQGCKGQSRRQQDHDHFPNSPGKLISWMGMRELFSALEMAGRMFHEITHSPSRMPRSCSLAARGYPTCGILVKCCVTHPALCVTHPRRTSWSVVFRWLPSIPYTCSRSHRTPSWLAQRPGTAGWRLSSISPLPSGTSWASSPCGGSADVSMGTGTSTTSVRASFAKLTWARPSR